MNKAGDLIWEQESERVSQAPSTVINKQSSIKKINNFNITFISSLLTEFCKLCYL